MIYRVKHITAYAYAEQVSTSHHELHVLLRSCPNQRIRTESLTVTPTPDHILDLDEALTRLTTDDPTAARVVTLHIFGGLSVEQVAECIGISRSTAYEQWAYARAWLRCALDDTAASAPK